MIKPGDFNATANQLEQLILLQKFLGHALDGFTADVDPGIEPRNGVVVQLGRQGVKQLADLSSKDANTFSESGRILRWTLLMSVGVIPASINVSR
jgi:hypothetical protein